MGGITTSSYEHPEIQAAACNGTPIRRAIFSE